MDIRVDTTFKDHRKRKRLASLCGSDGVLALIDFWLATAETHPTGELNGMDELDIELDANWTGERGKLVAAFLDCGFVERTDKGGFRVHDWPEHQAWVVGAPERQEHARKAIKARWDRQNRTPRTPKEYPENTPSILNSQLSNTPLPSFPLPSLPIQKKEDTPLPPKGESPTCAKPQSEPPAQKMRLDLHTWTWENITPADRDLWSQAYPACDIDAELAKAAAWSKGAGAKGRKSNWQKFFTNWLSRCQDKGGTSKTNTTRSFDFDAAIKEATK